MAGFVAYCRDPSMYFVKTDEYACFAGGRAASCRFARSGAFGCIVSGEQDASSACARLFAELGKRFAECKRLERRGVSDELRTVSRG